jgi:RsiW-degrading membrane proteinase PrsW (M82 family)
MKRLLAIPLIVFALPAMGVEPVDVDTVDIVWWLLAGAGIIGGVILLPAVAFHGSGALARKRSGQFRLPHPFWLALGVPIALAVGQSALYDDEAGLFFLAFVAGAALPPLVALTVAARRLDFPTTWRRLFAGLALGAGVSIPLAIVLELALPALVLAAALPLRDVVADALDYDSLEEFFYSPAMVVMLVSLAVVAPIAEELVKPIGAIVMARGLRSRSEAFIVGMAGGVAFAAIENMLYQVAGIQTWAGMVTVRAIGSVLHPLTAGMLGVAWYDVVHDRPGARPRLLAVFALSVTLHALWNGGIALLMTTFGAYYFETRTWEVNIFDVGLPGALLVLLILLSLLMWRILWLVTDRLRGERVDLMPSRLADARQLAGVALSLLLITVPVGALAAPIIADYIPRLLEGA